MNDHFKALWMLMCVTLFCHYAPAQSRRTVPVNSPTVDVRENGELRKASWTISPKIPLDVYDVYIKGKDVPLSFISGNDSVHFRVKPGKIYDFDYVLNGKDTAHTRIRGIKEFPNPTYSARYKAQFANKTVVEIPPVYELANIVIALTNTGINSKGLVIQTSPYYEQMRKWFDRFRDDPAVKTFDSLLVDNDNNYYLLKMDAYSFDFSDQGKIRQSKVYDRTSWRQVNQLRPYIPILQAFADKTRFKEFFKAHQPDYDKQIAVYNESIDMAGMQTWLNRNFPSTRYDCFRIIFSPLVGHNQSAHWFENNGFREMHAHVNFPYARPGGAQTLSPQANKVRDGNIVFTEINHAFINPEADKPQNTAGIQRAFTDLSVWNEKGKPAEQGYNDALSSFNEHMNWGLVSLRIADFAPAGEQDAMIGNIESMMTSVRGFKKFAPFNQFLVKLYKHRKEGQTLADLYPDIIRWFEKHK